MRKILIWLIPIIALAGSGDQKYYAEPLSVIIDGAITNRCAGGTLYATSPDMQKLLQYTWPNDKLTCRHCNTPDVSHGWFVVTNKSITSSVWQVTMHQLGRETLDVAKDLEDANVTISGATIQRGTNAVVDVKPPIPIIP